MIPPSPDRVEQVRVCSVDFDLPYLEIVSINTIKPILLLILDSDSQMAHGLCALDVDRKDMLWAIPKDPTIELECV